MAIVLIEATDAHFAWMLGAGAPPSGLRSPPGGVDAPSVLEKVRNHAANWMIVADGEVVGLCSLKRAADKDGVVEIGFGIAQSCRRRGHATHAVAALVKIAAHNPSIRSLIAETAEDNVASQHVLTRNGFVKTGTRSDPHDGSLILWRRDLLSDKVILERAISLCSDACYTIALQCRRLRSKEPEDEVFVFRWWADLQFLIIALRRLRSAAQTANIPRASSSITDALAEFDRALPRLDIMRNVGEHIGNYALNNLKRHHKNVSRKDLQVGTWDGKVFSWLDATLDIDIALAAAEKLFMAVKSARETVAARK